MTEPTKPQHELVSVEATVGLEEIAAIKVAEVERGLIISQEQTIADIRGIEAKADKLARQLPEQVVADTKENYPEIVALEKALKDKFSKTFNLTIALDREAKGVTICLEASGVLPLKGEKTKEILAETKKLKKDLSGLEDKMIDIKKRLQQLPHLERSAKAAVARVRLEKTTEGKRILSQIDRVMLPGLPAPKK